MESRQILCQKRPETRRAGKFTDNSSRAFLSASQGQPLSAVAGLVDRQRPEDYDRAIRDPLLLQTAFAQGIKSGCPKLSESSSRSLGRPRKPVVPGFAG